MGEPIKAVDMVRSIREAHYERIKDLCPAEKIEFFRKKARALPIFNSRLLDYRHVNGVSD
jgi:hypothetical protein